MIHLENIDQIALRCWITSGLQIPEVRSLNGDAGYLFSNMIAKYTLAASEYRFQPRHLPGFTLIELIYLLNTPDQDFMVKTVL